jgi:NAD(P)-dependent dehydrogenase (short-subunit alcohol dehydrogenase family)
MADHEDTWLPDPRLLQGRVALVPGGAGRIGEATSRTLAASGASVVVMDYDGERAESVASAITASGGVATSLAADLRDREQCVGAVEQTVAAHGRIDVLANVAGGMSSLASWRPLVEWTDEAWDTILHLNLGYVFWLCRAAIPRMAAGGGGTIVNVASIAGVFGSLNQSAYGAAKAGLIHLTKTLASECGPSNIRVNAVAPGVTLPEGAQGSMGEAAFDSVINVTPLRRLTRPENIARSILFFASPMSEAVTGQLIIVDGGVSSNFPYPSVH